MHSNGTSGRPQAISEDTISQAGADATTGNSSFQPPNHAGLHILIAHMAARTPSSMTTPTTPGHGHPAKLVIPHADTRVPSNEDTVPGYGHGTRFVPPCPNSPTSMPVLPRPSARVLRRSGLFSATHEVQDEGDLGEQERAVLGHPFFDVTRIGALQPSMETEEPQTCAETDGPFDQHPRNRIAGLGNGEDSSMPLEGA